MFAGSSLGCIYHYDLRNFNSVVRSMQAHTSSVQRIALQNTIKVSMVLLIVNTVLILILNLFEFLLDLLLIVL